MKWEQSKDIDRTLTAAKAVASVNRELAIIRRCFTLGRKNEKVAVVPFIEQGRENNRRIGFLETQQEARLATECGRFGLWLRTAFEIGLTYGWRLSEVQNLRVRQANLLKDTLTLDVGSTKNDEGRCVVLTDTLRTLVAECTRGKKPDDYVLTRVDGSDVKNFRKAWHRACIRAGLGRMCCPKCLGEKGESIPVDGKNTCSQCGQKWRWDRVRYRGLLFHDLRRSMARNCRNEGVAEEVIMEIGGWKTANVFKRYSIVNPNDTAMAVRKVEARRQRDLATVAQVRTSETHLAEFEQKMAETAPPSLQTPNSARRNRKAAGLPN